MENHFPFHNISEFENMIINIQNEGEEKVFKSFDVIKDPLERCRMRKLYFRAVNKLRKEK